MPGKQDEQPAAAERREDRPAAAAAPTVVQVESEETRRSRALADAQAEAARLKMDETEAGGGTHPGHYLATDGKTRIDANGVPLKDQGKD